MPRLHGIHPEDVVAPSSTLRDSGRFGRMSGKLPPFAPDTPQVRAAPRGTGKPGGITDAQDDPAAGPIRPG